MVNGEYPELALTEFELEDGDRVVWHYVDDYTTEADAETWLKAADISPDWRRRFESLRDGLRAFARAGGEPCAK